MLLMFLMFLIFDVGDYHDATWWRQAMICGDMGLNIEHCGSKKIQQKNCFQKIATPPDIAHSSPPFANYERNLGL